MMSGAISCCYRKEACGQNNKSGIVIIIIVMVPIYITFLIARITKCARAPVCCQTDLRQKACASAF